MYGNVEGNPMFKKSELGEVETKRGIFQEDSLSPLVFILALIPWNLILRKAKAAYEFHNVKRRLIIIFYVWMIWSCVVEVRKDWTH